MLLSHYTGWHYLFFLVGVVICLWIDLHAHKADKPISMRNAIIWSIIWVSLSMLFAVYVGFTHGSSDASLFLSGYFLEKSLSVDNLFVMMAIFSSFAVKDQYQHRVLYYGIVGALVLRMVFIAAGTSLINLLGVYAMTAFGLFVLWSGWKMWQQMRVDEEVIVDYSSHWAVSFARKFLPVHNQMDGHNFFIKIKNSAGKMVWNATPLFLCLLVIEMSDVMFAFDSVPAVIAITQDPFLVYTSNIFAILGLRSLYFLLAGAKKYLCHLEKAVIAILVYIGIKMLLQAAELTGFERLKSIAEAVHPSPLVSLIVVLGLLSFGIVASFIWPEKDEDKHKTSSGSGDNKSE